MAVSTIKKGGILVETKRVVVPFNNESAKSTSLSVEKNGYTVKGIAGWSIATSADYYPLQIYTQGNTLYAYLVHRARTSATTNINLDVSVMYEKN